MSTITKLKQAMTKPKFKAWLESQNPRTMAGHCGHPRKCAIAAYISDTVLSPNEQTSVDQDTIQIETLEAGGDPKSEYDYEYKHEIDTPPWASKFIEDFNTGSQKRKSFGTTLKILEAA